MRQILDIYRFVKFVEGASKELENENPAHIVTSASGFQSWHPITVSLKHRYIKKYIKTTPKRQVGFWQMLLKTAGALPE